MRGFPKWINTLEDVQNCLADFPAQTDAFLQGLINNRFIWQASPLAPGDEGINDATHMVVQEDQGGAMQSVQLTLAEDPNARLFRLGLTVAQAQAMIGQ